MTLYFTIEYGTQWGQSIEVEIWFPSSEGSQHPRRLPLQTTDGIHWEGRHRLPAYAPLFRYTYVVCRSGEVERREWEGAARLLPAADGRAYFLSDHWCDAPERRYAFSAAYAAATGRPLDEAPGIPLFRSTLVFHVAAPMLRRGQRLALLGSAASLGGWDARRPLLLSPTGACEYTLSVSSDGLTLPFQYKYVVVDEEGNVTWEEGPNRFCPLLDIGGERNPVIVLSDVEVRVSQPDTWRVAGLVVPLFSLRSEGSQGIGDFGDLADAVRWARRVGMHALQLLPLNDTVRTRSPRDSYPYNPISVCALHPIYADLRKLPLADEGLYSDMSAEWRRLNDLPCVDFVQTLDLKERYLRAFYREHGEEIMQRGSFSTFLRTNEEWLLPYGVFCHLRDTYGTADFRRWPCLASFDAASVREYAFRHAQEVNYYFVVQYLLHLQFQAAADFARSQGVFLKGDLPIGVSRDSVEVWQYPQFFHEDMAAGAPPDDFSAMGQNWGFPIYNWDCMAEDGYRWWKRRLGCMARYFDAFRIDHILGFFRIWQIPVGSSDARCGQFSPALPLSADEICGYGLPLQPWLFLPDARRHDCYHPRIDAHLQPEWPSLPPHVRDAFTHLRDDFFYRRHNAFWTTEALRRLSALTSSSRMLVCGEDLGMVPPCVAPVMQKLHILSLEIQSMPKHVGQTFADLTQNPYCSVSTPFTHDMPTLRQWWKENPRLAHLYLADVLHGEWTTPGEPSVPERGEDPSGELCEEVLRRHLECPSMLCLISLQDWLSVDEVLRNPKAEAERINNPANAENYWCYRMHLPLSRLMGNETFCEKVKSLIICSGR